jgi:hypothetical protein
MDLEQKLLIDGLCTGIRRGAQGLVNKTTVLLWYHYKTELLDYLPYIALRESWPLFEAACKISAKTKKIKSDDEGFECASEFIEQITMRYKDRDAYGLARLALGSWFTFTKGPQKLINDQWAMMQYALKPNAKTFWEVVLKANRSDEVTSFTQALRSYETKTELDEAKKLCFAAASKVLTTRKIIIPPLYRERVWEWGPGAFAIPDKPPASLVVPYSENGVRIVKKISEKLGLSMQESLFTWMARHDITKASIGDGFWFDKYLTEISKMGVAEASELRLIVNTSSESATFAGTALGKTWYG